VHAKLSQFIGNCPANAACSSGNECCQRIISHFAISDLGANVNPSP